MILGGGQCQKCKCIPCDPCTATCTEPHSGSAFEVVYTRYFEGAEAGNVTDGYLTASGDSDTSDPYDGMDGNGPWYQEVSGDFSINNTQTRYPCVVRLSFWRNNYTLGANTIPPPSSDLTVNKITVVCTAGEVLVGDHVVKGGETYETGLTVPLVTGGGDQSANDPRTGVGAIALTPRCNTATFTVKARIEWNVKKRQHVLYGIVRECYEEGTPCSTVCSGSPPPNTVYVTISNYTGPTYDAGIPMDIEGTYVLERVPAYCQTFQSYWTNNQCRAASNPLGSVLFGPLGINLLNGTWGFYMAHYAQVDGICQVFEAFVEQSSLPIICGSGVLYSGTNGTVRIANTVASNCFDWKIEA